MNTSNINLILDNLLLSQLEFEGMLLHPTRPENGILVMSQKSDNLTLHIFKTLLIDENEYHIDKELTTKSFNDVFDKLQFLQIISDYNVEKFSALIKKYDIKHPN